MPPPAAARRTAREAASRRRSRGRARPGGARCRASSRSSARLPRSGGAPFAIASHGGERHGGRLGERIGRHRRERGKHALTTHERGDDRLRVPPRRPNGARHVLGGRHQRRNEDRDDAVDAGIRGDPSPVARTAPRSPRQSCRPDSSRSPPAAERHEADPGFPPRAAAPRGRSPRRRRPRESRDRRRWSRSPRAAPREPAGATTASRRRTAPRACGS